MSKYSLELLGTFGCHAKFDASALQCLQAAILAGFPHEVLNHIAKVGGFKEMQAMSLVCKDWRAGYFLDPLLFTKLTVPGFATDEDLAKKLEEFTNISGKRFLYGACLFMYLPL